MKLTIFFITAVLSTILSDPAHAMSQWDKLNNEVESLYQQGDYNRAISVAKKALQAAERELDPAQPAVGTSLNSLALLYNAQGQYAQAEPLFKRALTIFEKSPGPESQEAAAGLNNLAMVYRKQGQYRAG